MKKLLSVLLSAIIIATMFIGCNKYEGTVESTDNTSSIDELVSEDFNETVIEHKTEVPQGFIGIYTAEDFQYIYNNPWLNYILMDNIDFSNYKDKWEATDISIFDGNNYTISNYKNDQPLFDSAFRIYDLNVTNAEINCNDSNSVSILCKLLYKFETFTDEKYISNCNISGNINLSCTSYSDEYEGKANNAVSGIVVDAREGTIDNCCYNGNITVNLSSEEYKERNLKISGIVGETSSDVIISNCASNGTIFITEDMENLSLKIGGIVGNSYGEIRNCSNYMNITFENDIPLSNDYKIINGIGGIAGVCSKYILSCSNHGNISTTHNYEPTIGKIPYVGGICGYGVGCDIANCFNEGDIDSVIVGGIVGISLSNISTSYNIGVLSGGNLIDGTLDNLKVAGAIEAFGSDDGKHFAQMNYCYYLDNGINPVYKNTKFPYVFALSSENALLQESYQGFDFENVWEMGNDTYPYPKLKNSPTID